MRRIAKAHLTAIVEPGFLLLDEDGAKPLFRVVSETHKRQSPVVTTNLEFSR